MRRRVREKVVVFAVASLGVASVAVADESPLALRAQRAQRGEVVPPVLEDVEQMCALLTSCDALPIPAAMLPSDFGTCVKMLADDLTRPSALSFSLTVRECGLVANSCAQLRTCALRGAPPETCVGRGKVAPAGYCDSEGRALTCFHDRIAAVRDCPRGGEQCAVREGQALCALGPCTAGLEDARGPVCSASGTRILQCEKGKLVSLDCAAFGLKCAPQPGGAACAPPTAACTGDAKRCDGNVAVECFRGHEVRVDCAASGLVCGAGGTQVGSCTAPIPASGACDPAAPSRCDGAILRYCAAGRPRGYLCKSLAFNRCVTEAKGARCAN